MTHEEILAQIKAIAEQDAQNDMDLVEASGLELSEENVALTQDMATRHAFLRQLEAKRWRESRQ